MGVKVGALVYRPSGPVQLDLTPHLPSIHDERHCGAVLRTGVCAVCRNLIYLFIGTLASLFRPHPTILAFYPWIHTSAALVCFDVYPLIFILVMLALRDLSHIGTILVYFISFWFYFCSQYPLPAAHCREDEPL